MSSEMVERVAKAIYEQQGANQGGYALTFEQINEVRRQCFFLEAIAAIKAMREPTEAMIDASNREWDGRMSYRSSGAWQACIDAALPTPSEKDKDPPR